MAFILDFLQVKLYSLLKFHWVIESETSIKE